MPTCSKCHHSKPDDSFKRCEPCRQKSRIHSNRWYANHRELAAARNAACRSKRPEQYRTKEREWRAKNHEKVSARRKAWRRKYPEQERAYIKKWRAQNKEKMHAIAKAWRLANVERNRAAKQLWASTHLEKRVACQTRRYAQKKNSPTTEIIDRMAIYTRDGGKCHICHRKVSSKAFHIDHLIPLSRGGAHTADNVATAHPFCNMSRGAGRIPAQLRLLS